MDYIRFPFISSLGFRELCFLPKLQMFEENLFTAPASITGLPAVVVGGAQLVGPAFSDGALLSVAALYEEASK